MVPPSRHGDSAPDRAPAGDQQELGMVEVRAGRGVGAGGHRPERPRATSPASRASSRSSRGVKHEVHRSWSASTPCSSLRVVRSWLTPAIGVEGVGVLEEAHLEVGGEGGDGQRGRPGAPPGPCPARMPPSGSSRRPRGRVRCAGPDLGCAGEAERALAQRDDRVELGVEGQVAGVERARRWRRAGRRWRASSTKRCEMSTPTTSMPRSARAWAWRPGPQPTSSTRWPGSSPSTSTRKATSLAVPRVNE